MEVKNVIANALYLIGRAELVSALSGNWVDAEAREVINTLIYCFNAVEDELARKYIPLIAREELTSADGRFYFSSFAHNPVRIRKVKSEGKAVKYEVLPEYLSVKAKRIEVEYEYSPSGKTIDGKSDYGAEVGESLIAFGIASEYSLINGEAEAADEWEKRYRKQLDGVQRTLPVCASLPPRRWV